MIINPKDQALMDKFYKSNEIVIVGGKPVDWRTMPETEPHDDDVDDVLEIEEASSTKPV